MPSTSGTNPDRPARSKILRGIRQITDEPLFAAFIWLTISIVAVALIGLLLVACTDLIVVDVQRVVDQLTTLAAITLLASITLSFVSKGINKSWVLAFGVLSIGALLVPTNDLIRIVLVTARGETDFENLFVPHATSQGRKEAVQDRAHALYGEVMSARFGIECENNSVQEILEFLKRDQNIDESRARELYRMSVGTSMSEDCEAHTVETIVRFLAVEEEKEMLHLVDDRGLLHVLATIGSDGEREKLLFDHVGDERFRADMQFLRAEGLVRFMYDDMGTIQLTSAGHSVLTRAGVDVATASGDPVTESSSEANNAIELRNDYYSELHSLGYGGNRFPFAINEGGYYTLDVSGLRGIDPMVELFRRADNSDDLTSVGADDDGGSGLSSHLSSWLEAGDYVLDIMEFDGDIGEVVVTIRRER